MNKKNIYFILSLLIILFPLEFKSATTSGFSFLKSGVSPRAIGMGDTYSMDKLEPSAAFYNPAMLGLSSNTELQLIHKEWFKDSKAEFLGFTTHINKIRLGIGINSFSVQNIELRTKPGPAEGIFTARNLVFSLSSAYKFDYIILGVSGKFLYEKIHINEASGYAFDLGALYSYTSYFKAALSINNIGKMNSLLSQSSELPLNLRFSLSSYFKFGETNLSIHPTLQLLTIFNEKKNHLQAGTEIEYDNLIFLRLGAQSGFATHNLSTGFGINYKAFSFDYAFLPFKYELGNSHSFSIKIKF